MRRRPMIEVIGVLSFWNADHLDPVTSAVLGSIELLVSNPKQVGKLHVPGKYRATDAHRQLTS